MMGWGAGVFWLLRWGMQIAAEACERSCRGIVRRAGPGWGRGAGRSVPAAGGSGDRHSHPFPAESFGVRSRLLTVSETIPPLDCASTRPAAREQHQGLLTGHLALPARPAARHLAALLSTTLEPPGLLGPAGVEFTKKHACGSRTMARAKTLS